MLYVSTRNRTDSFTAVRTLCEDYAPDGGMFVPLRFPPYEEIFPSFNKKTFGENVACILNYFFNTELSGWDIDSCAGRQPIKLKPMNHKLLIAELWHNQESDYLFFEQAVYSKLCMHYVHRTQPTHWAKIAIRMAVLFALCDTISSDGFDSIDISVSTDSYSIPMAVWYARKMGLPFQNIIFSCTDTAVIWDLFHHGECNTVFCGEHNSTIIERIIYDSFGLNEALRYLEIVNRKGTYVLTQEQLSILSDSLYVSVLSSKRIDAIIASIHRSNQYIVDSETAVSFGGIQNYRAQTGHSSITLLLSSQSPLSDMLRLSQILGVSTSELKKIVKDR